MREQASGETFFYVREAPNKMIALLEENGASKNLTDHIGRGAKGGACIGLGVGKNNLTFRVPTWS